MPIRIHNVSVTDAPHPIFDESTAGEPIEPVKKGETKDGFSLLIHSQDAGHAVRAA